MAKTLKTRQTSYTRVFREVVRKLETHPDARRVFGDRIYSWKGEGNAAEGLELAPKPGEPCARLTPVLDQTAWFDPSSQRGDLVVNVELAAETRCVDDVVDLWGLLVEALHPGDEAFCQRLRDAGAVTGEILFLKPAFEDDPAAAPAGKMFGTAALKLSVMFAVNP